MLVKCAHCGDEFNIKPHRVKRSKNNFCSKKCHDDFRHEMNVKDMSEQVGEDFKNWIERRYLIDFLSIRNISNILYGDEKHMSSVRNWLNKFDIPIRQGSEAIKTQWIDADERRELSRNLANENLQQESVRKRIKKIQQTEEYKLKQSKTKSGSNNGMFGVIGENHPRWDESRTHEKRIEERKTFEYSQWRNSVFERDGWKCRICNDDTGGNLTAHHLNSYDEFESERYLVDNGITLCDECHKRFHSLYGYGKNTKEQFESFVNEAS